MHLLLLLLIITTVSLLSSLGLLPANTARATTAEGRRHGEVDMLLGVEADDEGRHINDLLADADVTLTDQDTSVVNRLGEAELIDASLEAALQEILELQGQHVIELHARLVEDTDTHETANEGIAFKETLWVLFVKSKKLTVRTISFAENALK